MLFKTTAHIWKNITSKIMFMCTHITTIHIIIITTYCYKTEHELFCENNSSLKHTIITIQDFYTRPEVPSPWPINLPCESCKESFESFECKRNDTPNNQG